MIIIYSGTFLTIDEQLRSNLQVVKTKADEAYKIGKFRQFMRNMENKLFMSGVRGIKLQWMIEQLSNYHPRAKGIKSLKERNKSNNIRRKKQQLKGL